MIDPANSVRRVRLLVAIASYGERNLKLLKQIIARYRSLAMKVDVVVLSEAHKELGPGVEVVVGLPSTNPWSLPFAHKAMFAERIDHYDLFAYSEDDMEVTEDNIQAFLKATPQLAPDEIAGFLRYEVDGSGALSLPDVQGTYHWRPESVRQRGEYQVAEFTNEHAAFYLLTQAQLRRAIASGGFLRAPYEGRYDMLCSAATDPYTSCGFRKVICISAIERFLIGHLSNRYVGQVGLPLESVKAQIETLVEILDRRHPASSLCGLESRLGHGWWSKSYYERSQEELLRMVPGNTQEVLSIGCGWGATEAILMERGSRLTALPLDSVIGAAAARRGIKVIYGGLEEGMRKVSGRRFDTILMSNLLHLLPDPFGLLRQCALLLGAGGGLLLAGPNFDYLPVLARRTLGAGEYGKLRSYSQGGIHPLSVGRLTRWFRRAGLECDRLLWQRPTGNGSLSGSVAEPRGLAQLSQRAWRRLRSSGLDWDSKYDRAGGGGPGRSLGGWLRPGRLLAQEWMARAVKRG